MYDTYT
jgi:hypothetical protein